MKNLFKNMMLVAVAAMAFVGCTQEIEVSVAPKNIIKFTANLNDDTRSQFTNLEDGYWLSKWEGNEVATFVVTDGDTVITKAKSSSVALSDDKSVATFSVDFGGLAIPENSTITAYIGSWSELGSEMIAAPNTTQYSNDNSVDSASHILKATTTYVKEAKSYDLHFSHAAAYGRMTIPFDSYNIDEVVITLNGRYEYHILPQYAYNRNPSVVWFACGEQDANTIAVDVTVNGMEYIQTVDMSGKGRRFEVGKVANFSMNNFELKPFEADYTATTFEGIGVNVEGDSTFKVSGTDFSFDVYVDANKSTKTSLNEGLYELQSSMYVVNDMKAGVANAVFGGSTLNLDLDVDDNRSGSMLVTYNSESNEYTINMVIVSKNGGVHKVKYTGEITEPAAEVVELNTITPGTYDGGNGYYQYTLSDGTDKNKLTLCIGENHAKEYSIDEGEYTWMSSVSFLNAGYCFTAPSVYKNGEYVGKATAGTVNVVNDGDNYTITFDITTYKGGDCQFVANVTLVDPNAGQGGDAPAIDLTGYTKCNLVSITNGDFGGLRDFIAHISLQTADSYKDSIVFELIEMNGGISVANKTIKEGTYTYVTNWNNCTMEASYLSYCGMNYQTQASGFVEVYNTDGTYTIKVDFKVQNVSLKYYYQGTL